MKVNAFRVYSGDIACIIIIITIVVVVDISCLVSLIEICRSRKTFLQIIVRVFVHQQHDCPTRSQA